MELRDQHRHRLDWPYDSSGLGGHHQDWVWLQPNWLAKWCEPVADVDVQLRDGRKLQQCVQHEREDA